MAEPILTADHLLEDLFARVDGHIVDGLVPLGADKVQLPVVAECAPLRVDDHVFLAGEVGRIQRADVLVDREVRLALLKIPELRIRDPVPFDPWILDPGWVKNQDPDPG